jgi:hypothetical protein
MTARPRTPPATSPSCAIKAPERFDDVDCVPEAIVVEDALPPAAAVAEGPVEDAATPPVTPMVVS